MPHFLHTHSPTHPTHVHRAPQVMGVIRGIVADGTTIAATIHSPSSHCFSLFHRLIVLVSGNVVYAGAIGARAGRVGGLTCYLCLPDAEARWVCIVKVAWG